MTGEVELIAEQADDRNNPASLIYILAYNETGFLIGVGHLKQNSPLIGCPPSVVLALYLKSKPNLCVQLASPVGKFCIHRVCVYKVRDCMLKVSWQIWLHNCQLAAEFICKSVLVWQLISHTKQTGFI